MTTPLTERLLELISTATDMKGWTDELDSDDIAYDDDPVKQWERRVRESEVAALAAIAYLLLRRDEELWDAWVNW